MHFLFQQLKPTTCLNTLGNLEPQLNSTNFESKKNALQIFPEKVNLWKEICKKKLISNLSSAQTTQGTSFVHIRIKSIKLFHQPHRDKKNLYLIRCGACAYCKPPANYFNKLARRKEKATQRAQNYPARTIIPSARAKTFAVWPRGGSRRVPKKARAFFAPLDGRVMHWK